MEEPNPARVAPTEADPAPGDHYPGESPQQVTLPAMIQDWDYLTFLHWRVEPEAVQRLLPSGLTVDVCEGAAWVGLVPFYLRIRLGPLPPVPYATIFPETNVRTYVHGPDGRAGLWFFSLDVPRLATVLAARVTYALPYMWSDMSIERGRRELRYHCHRRWRAFPLATSSVTVEIGEEIPPTEVTDLEHFLTARWRLYTNIGGCLATAPVEHRPWPLQRARVTDMRDSLVLAAGLPSPDGPPLVHYSPGVRARIGLPRPAVCESSRLAG